MSIYSGATPSGTSNYSEICIKNPGREEHSEWLFVAAYSAWIKLVTSTRLSCEESSFRKSEKFYRLRADGNVQLPALISQFAQMEHLETALPDVHVPVGSSSEDEGPISIRKAVSDGHFGICAEHYTLSPV